MSFEDCEKAHQEFQEELRKYIKNQVTNAVQHIMSELLEHGEEKCWFYPHSVGIRRSVGPLVSHGHAHANR
jgi:hypothetical protein